MAKKQVSEEVQLLLMSVFDHFDKEDDSVRQRQIRDWRKLKYFWDGFTNVWYSEIAHDWRVWDREVDFQNQDYYDKSINMFKALLESITAALSVNTPNIVCYPDDAESYGTYNDPKYKNEEVDQTNQVCPICGTQMPDEELSDNELNEYAPDESDVNVQNVLQN